MKRIVLIEPCILLDKLQVIPPESLGQIELWLRQQCFIFQVSYYLLWESNLSTRSKLPFLCKGIIFEIINC